MSESSLIDKCCLIGESVAGNPTHFMIERAFDAAELDWRFLTFEVAAEQFTQALLGTEALGFRGVKLLAPYRQQAAAELEQLTERAKRTGAVSCLVREAGRLIGDDLTGAALVAATDEVTGKADAFAGRHAVLLGAKKAAASFADALLEQNVASLTIADADPAAAEALASELKLHWPAIEIDTLAWEEPTIDLPESTDCLIATASWSREDDPEMASLMKPNLRPGMLVADVRVGSSRTPLLRQAADRQATVVDGLQILVHETSLALTAWTGVSIDRAILNDAAEEFLGV